MFGDVGWKSDFMELDSLEAAAVELSYKRLDLSDCGLEKIPKTVITTWLDLEELILSENRLNMEDASVQVLLESPKLKKLILARTCISTLPSYINELSRLTYLDVSINFLTKLPENIVELTSLTDLILDHNELSDIPMLHDFRKLRVLSAAYNKLTNDCSFIRRGMKSEKNGANDKNQFSLCADLAAVNLKGNFLKGVIKLANYGNLTDLDVSENSIEQLDLSTLSALKCVNCSKNQLTELLLNGSELTSCIASNNKLKSLTVSTAPLSLLHLDLSFNELQVLPEWVTKCNLLQTLTASHNRLTELPEDIFCNEDCSLNTLELSFNQLTVLPQVMRRVPLQRLYLQNNSLITLPRHFFIASSNLNTLNVSKNCLKELPQFISKNEKLEYLYLTSNALTDITPLLNCTHLKTLHVAYNAISSLPERCVSAWPLIEELNISGNSLSQIPENVQNWTRLRVFRAHSNLFVFSPSFMRNYSLKILDLSNNYLEKIDLMTLIPKQLQYLDISGNSRLHVDSKQFYHYRNQRSLNLIDVSGHNRNSLPFHPSDEGTCLQSNLPWILGFSETVGNKDRLHIAQLRLPEFCNSEALIGIFDTMNRTELSTQLVKSIPRILLEERTVKETASNYMKYTMLSAHRELKEYSWQSETYCMLCHICKQKESLENNQIQRYVLRVASIGDAVTILCRNTGSLTLSHSSTENRVFKDVTQTKFSPDPRVTEIVLHETDQFLLLANKSLWDVMSKEEAVAEVRSITNPVLAAKRLQDLAQSYGCNGNLSIIVLRFHNFDVQEDIMNKDTRFKMKSQKVTDVFCNCEQNKLLYAEPVITGSNRSSPSGQSDKCNGLRVGQGLYEDGIQDNYCYRKYSQPLSVQGKQNENTFCGSLEDGDESYSDKSTLQVSEERFRCWEYMLEQNTQMLFDKELDTLSRNFTKRSVPSRPELWSPRTKSVSHLPDCIQNAPFLSKRFGSARSYNATNRLDITRRSLNGGPNAAYFGSLQRLMPYHLEYNFSEIKEKFDNTVDSLEQDGRMHKYWDVATTEL